MFLQAIARSRDCRLLLFSFVIGFALLVPTAQQAVAEGEPAGAEASAVQAGLYPTPGTIGWDISWPQCDDGTKPAGPVNFAIIGVNGGRMNTKNDCLREQFAWASTGRTIPQVYVNTSGMPDGYVHQGCNESDLACNAYQYGHEGAAYAVTYARSQNVDPRVWWLDVETANFWTADKAMNARVLSGMIDYLQSTGHSLGVYSTPYQWGIIAGDFAPQLPVWTAGAADLAEAPTRCTDRYAFGGGKVAMVQYVSEVFDTNYFCHNTLPPKVIAPLIAAEP